jgi:hypothetical protein
MTLADGSPIPLMPAGMPRGGIDSPQHSSVGEHTSMTSRKARCHCGQLVHDCDGDPIKVSLCHCLDCQRRTGSTFSIAVFYERAHVSIAQGAPQSFQRQSASGFPVRFHFCGGCGSNVFWEPERLPHLIGVAAGAFADPALRCPEQSVWTKDKHAWVSLPAGMATFDVNPPQSASR